MQDNNKNDELSETKQDEQIVNQESSTEMSDAEFLKVVEESKVKPATIINSEKNVEVKNVDTNEEIIKEEVSKPEDNIVQQEIKSSESEKPIEKPKSSIVTNVTTSKELEKQKNNTIVTDDQVIGLVGNEIEETSKYIIDETKIDNIEEEQGETISEYIEKQYGDLDETELNNSELKISKHEERPITVESDGTEDSDDEYLSQIGYKKREIAYYGGDGVTTSFKNKISSTSKLVKQLDINDTVSIEADDISRLTISDQQKMYINNIAPILNPIYSVIPLVTSGLVITITAFTWPDIAEICKIDEMGAELDRGDDDFIYNMNTIHLKKRRKQIELFYNHIFAISGFNKVPSFDEFCKLVKFPDLQQLFFGAYSASFTDKVSYDISCSSCGSTNEVEASPKDLCFYLNKNVNLDQLNDMLTKGVLSSSDQKTIDFINEMKEYDIVKNSDKVFRSGKGLPDTNIIPQYKVPSLSEYLEGLEAIIENFKNKSVTDIDSTYDLTEDDLQLRSYLFFDSLLFPTIDNKNAPKMENGKKIYNIIYNKISQKSMIMNTLRQLSYKDYDTLINNKNLRILTQLQGIRHVLDPKKCTHCGVTIDKMWLDPEALFFTNARRQGN